MTKPHQNLYNAFDEYQKLMIDTNTRSYFETLVSNFKPSEAPKAFAVKAWLDYMWGTPLDLSYDSYHKRKANADYSNFDCTMFGEPPHDFYELKEELERAMLKEDIDNTENLSSDLLRITKKELLEKCLTLDTPFYKEVLCVEVEPKELDRVYEDGVLYRDKCNYKMSLDGSKCLILCADKITDTSQTTPLWEMAKKFYSDFSVIPYIFEEYGEKLNSSDYTQQTDI